MTLPEGIDDGGAPRAGPGEFDNEADETELYKPAAKLPPADREDEPADHGDLNWRCARFARNDVGNAKRLIGRHGEDLVHVTDVGWHAWDGQRWAGPPEGKIRADRLAVATAAAIRSEARAAAQRRDGNGLADPLTQWATASGNNSRLTGMLRWAQPELPRGIEELDAPPELLNVANGTVDLRTGAFRPHRREDYLSKLSPVEWDPDADCPLWRDFLEEVLPDEEVREFVRRYAGYAATGETGEEVLALFYGAGANGKSTFVETIARLLGDYALGIPFASLLHDDRRSGSQASPDLARLPGARWVMAAEPDLGQRFSESTMKQITGRDTITARHLNREFFDFRPKFKLILSMNNRPTVRGQDEGIWRRILLVPWTVTIPSERRDRHLRDKLWSEAPGILAWLAGGARDWYASGLRVPLAVRAATESYRSEQNPLGRFLHECTHTVPGQRVRTAELYDAYAAWCRNAAVDPPHKNLFGRMMTERGFPSEQVGGVVYRAGVELIVAPADDGGEGDARPEPPTPDDEVEF